MSSGSSASKEQRGGSRGARKKGKSSSEVLQLTMIQSMTSVACVRWRSAAHEFQLASSSSVVDPTLSVWDVENPYIPIAVLKGHSLR